MELDGRSGRDVDERANALALGVDHRRKSDGRWRLGFDWICIAARRLRRTGRLSRLKAGAKRHQVLPRLRGARSGLIRAGIHRTGIGLGTVHLLPCIARLRLQRVSRALSLLCRPPNLGHSRLLRTAAHHAGRRCDGDHDADSHSGHRAGRSGFNETRTGLVAVPGSRWRAGRCRPGLTGQSANNFESPAQTGRMCCCSPRTHHSTGSSPDPD